MVKRGEFGHTEEWNGEPHEPTMINFEQEPLVPDEDMMDLGQIVNESDRKHGKSMYDPGMPMGGPMPPAAPILVTPPGGGPPMAMMVPPGGGPLVPYAPV